MEAKYEYKKISSNSVIFSNYIDVLNWLRTIFTAIGRTGSKYDADNLYTIDRTDLCSHNRIIDTDYRFGGRSYKIADFNSDHYHK